jgi:FMN phosphatase YigB (HAD superfamily)
MLAILTQRGGIRHYFDHLWTSRELGAAKPDPAFFTAILSRLELEPEACLMIGNDYDKDIVPAKAAGLQTIWLAPGSLDAFPAADLVVHSLHDLIAAIGKVAGQVTED